MQAKLLKAEGIPANNGLIEGEIYQVETEEKYPGVFAVLSGPGVSRSGLFYMQNRFEKIEEGEASK
jgi:hypothetical protein